jgi:hypothetical protein
MTGDERATDIGRARRRRTVPRPSDVDVVALKRDLRDNVRGEVRFDAGSRGLYANDFSIYRHVPIGVVIPRDADDDVGRRGRLPPPRRADPPARLRHRPGWGRA